MWLPEVKFEVFHISTLIISFNENYYLYVGHCLQGWNDLFQFHEINQLKKYKKITFRIF